MELLLELDGEDRFLDLPGDRALGGEVRELHVLLGDGRAALADPAALEVLPRGPGDADGVDAAVAEEVPVLGGQHGVDQDLGHLLELDVDPVLLTEQLGRGGPGVALADGDLEVQMNDVWGWTRAGGRSIWART